MLFPVEHDPLVDLVGVHAYIGSRVPENDGGGLLELLPRRNAASRVRRSVDIDETCAIGDQRKEIAPAKAEPGAFLEMKRNGRRADVANERFVNREAWARIDDLVTGVAVRLLRKTDWRLRSGKYDYTVGSDPKASPRPHRVRDRFAQGENALGVVVMRHVVVDLPLYLLRDVAREGKVRLTDVAPHDVMTVVLDLLDVRPDLEGVFGVDHSNAIGVQSSRRGGWGSSGCHRFLLSGSAGTVRANRHWRIGRLSTLPKGTREGCRANEGNRVRDVPTRGGGGSGGRPHQGHFYWLSLPSDERRE